MFIRKALAEGKVAIGMTRAEVGRVFGEPTRVNTSLYPSGRHDQLIFERQSSTIYVYTQNDIVTAIQSSEKAAMPPLPPTATQARPCPSQREIWDLEVERSKLDNRYNDRLQAELAKQIRDARNCGR